MWSNSVVVIAPLLNRFLCFIDRSEPMLIQALISEFAIQAFDKGVLSGLAGLDKAKLHA